MKEKLDGVFCTRLKFCREFLDAELKSRDLEWKIHRKEKCLARMALVCDNTTGVEYLLAAYLFIMEIDNTHVFCFNAQFLTLLSEFGTAIS